MLRTLIAAAALVLIAAPALAKDARCYTTDDGYYDCNFEGMGGDGSFEISAAGYPSFQLLMDGPGVASGYGQYEPGGRYVPLPGSFERSRRDGACWQNDETGVEICAW